MGEELELAVTENQRNAAVEHLRQAVATSNLGLERFSEAVGIVLAASTTDEIARVLDGIAPVVRMTPPNRRLNEPVLIDTRSGSIELNASWQLARETRVVSTSGRVLLDLTVAEFDDLLVDLDLSSQSGSITVVVPHAVDVQFLEMTGHSGSVRNELGPTVSLPGAPLIRIRARTTSGRIVVRRPLPPKPPKARRFWARRRQAVAG